MAITITTDGTTTILDTPYHPALPARAKALGGRWQAVTKVWAFDARDEQRVRDLARDIYGTDGADQPTATIRVKLHNRMEDPHSPSIYLAGHEIAHRPGRDMAVRLGAGVVIIEGRFASSAGSMRYPSLGDVAGIVVEVRDLPQSVADRILATTPDATLVGGESERIEALRSERAALRARLAEVDAALDALGVTT